MFWFYFPPSYASSHYSLSFGNSSPKVLIECHQLCYGLNYYNKWQNLEMEKRRESYHMDTGSGWVAYDECGLLNCWSLYGGEARMVLQKTSTVKLKLLKHAFALAVWCLSLNIIIKSWIDYFNDCLMSKHLDIIASARRWRGAFPVTNHSLLAARAFCILGELFWLLYYTIVGKIHLDQQRRRATIEAWSIIFKSIIFCAFCIPSRCRSS